MANLIFISILAIFWLLLSNHISPLLLSLGTLSCIITAVIAVKMGLLENNPHNAKFYGRLPRYLLFLAKEIILANIAVAKSILSSKDKIDPGFIKVNCEQKSDLGQLTHANSITLTPGTISCDIEDNIITVHALLKNNVDEEKSQYQTNLIQKVEGTK
jgi:multicomponent Na+:H+ antiporter subunit E